MFFEWLINKNKEKFYPITHSDGVLVGDDKLTNVLNKKQEKLVSSENIKTINGESILGSGDIEIQGGEGGTQLIQGEFYSDKEVCIGRWTSGKPLYQKTVFIPSDILEAGVSAKAPHNIADIEQVVSWSGGLQFNSGSLHQSRLQPVDVTQNSSMNGSETFSIYSITKENVYYIFGQMLFYSKREINGIYVTIKYTKTTDTAETPIPQLANKLIIRGEYYSEEETCIGRWHDNKPIYQKTIIITELPTEAGQLTYLHNIENIDSICSWDGYMISEEDTHNTYKFSQPWMSFADMKNIDYDYRYSNLAYVTNSSIIMRFGVDRSNFVAKFVIKYTKTTDTADTPIPESVIPSLFVKSVECPIYLGSQVIYDYITSNTTSRTNFFACRKANDVYKSLINIPMTIPDGYKVLHRISASITTSGGNAFIIGINGVDLLSDIGWTDTPESLNFRKNKFSDFFDLAKDFPVEPPYVYDGVDAFNIYCKNSTTGTGWARNITIHAYLVKDDSNGEYMPKTLIDADKVQAMINESIGSVLGGEF